MCMTTRGRPGRLGAGCGPRRAVSDSINVSMRAFHVPVNDKGHNKRHIQELQANKARQLGMACPQGGIWFNPTRIGG